MRRLASLFLFLTASFAVSQSVNPDVYGELRWRCIGPFRGGRTVGAAGVPQQPNVFYIGVNNGGVWKSTDFGRVWRPIFDDQPTGSIGTIAVAPSDPNVIYVGSGEGLQRPDLSVGDGIYKSVDAGKTWAHLGLREGLQIASIIIDPKDPNRLFVAVLGHPCGPNVERGIYRSTNGGQSFEKVLYKDENTGGVALAFDPSNAQNVYAVLWAGRQGPWENGSWQGPNSGLFKSTDGGTTWHELKNGLPTFKEGLGRIGIAVCQSQPNRVYALVDADQKHGGLYRSDDAGGTWTQTDNEGRIWGRGSDFAEVKVDTRNSDVVYIANTESYKSTDGGHSFTGWKGAPGGDDYHTIWINPDNPDIILLAADQGAVVTVNGGDTWSSWYNQPTAQFYHVSTDNQIPYNVYGGQQESGSVGTSSRGNDGQITFREWHPVGIDEYGYVAPDPLNPNIIYGGRVEKWDRLTGQVQNVAPGGRGAYRVLRTAPVMFSPVNPHVLYFAGNFLFKTTDGGHSWDTISPDLSREQPTIPNSVGIYRAETKLMRRGVIYALAPSYRDENTIWAGTDDGLVHVTRDGGKTWTNVTPPELTDWSKVSQIDSGHFDTETAYIAVNRIRCDDLHPYLYRTHDGGKTWQKIVSGLPNDPINTVREDPRRLGLLYAGSERAVYFSLDDGDTWNPLRQNMPASSIRDLVIHNNDLVVGTHGRSFWILDDITPLREMAAATEARLFTPATTYRFRRDTNTDTPLPPEEPGGENPPDGAIINYFLPTAATGPVVLEILDSNGQLVRKFSSDDKPEEPEEKELEVPYHWVRPPQVLSREAGGHRFTWTMRYELDGPVGMLPISAIEHDTPAEPEGPLAMPGRYRVRLTVDGKVYEKGLTLRLDPRISTPMTLIQQQNDISMRCYHAIDALREVTEQIGEMRKSLKSNPDKLADFEKGLKALEAGGPGLVPLASAMRLLMMQVDAADVAPTQVMLDTDTSLQRRYKVLMDGWAKLKKGS